MPAPVKHLPLLLFYEEDPLLHQFPESRPENERGRRQCSSDRDEGHYRREDLARIGARNLGWSLSSCQETHEVDGVNVGPPLNHMQALGPDYHHSRQQQQRIERAPLERRQWMHNITSQTQDGSKTETLI